MAQALSTRVFAVVDHFVSCSERMGRCPVLGEEGGCGMAFGLSCGEDGQRHVHGSGRLSAPLGCDLLRWLETGEG
jgi:hypothetical protein